VRHTGGSDEGGTSRDKGGMRDEGREGRGRDEGREGRGREKIGMRKG
jgi:hypothetical protein